MEKQVYGLSPQFRSMAVMGLLGSVAALLVTTGAALFAPPYDKHQLAPLHWLIGFFVVGVLFFVWVLRVPGHTYMEVTDTHIIHRVHNKRPVHLAWLDVKSVKDNATMQRLELRSKSTNLILKVGYEFESFEELRQVIAAKSGKAVT